METVDVWRKKKPERIEREMERERETTRGNERGHICNHKPVESENKPWARGHDGHVGQSAPPA